MLVCLFFQSLTNIVNYQISGFLSIWRVNMGNSVQFYSAFLTLWIRLYIFFIYLKPINTTFWQMIHSYPLSIFIVCFFLICWNPLYILGILSPCLQCKLQTSLAVCHFASWCCLYGLFRLDSPVGFTVSHSSFDYVAELGFSSMTSGC